MRNLAFFAFIIFSLLSCNKNDNTENRKIKEIGERFFETYSERKNVEKITSFYADDFQYENVIFQTTTESAVELFLEIYGWKDSSFNFKNSETIHLETLTVNDSVIVGVGNMMPYLYRNNEIEELRFVIQLYLDENHKIKKQIDWFDYPVEEIIQMQFIRQSIKIE